MSDIRLPKNRININDLEITSLADYSFLQVFDLFDNVDFYLMARIHGVATTNQAFLAAFGPENACELLPRAVSLLEANPYVQARYRAILKKADPKLMWSLGDSIMTLKDVATDRNEKGASKIAAVKELNVLLDITYTDEKGNTQKKLADFYAAGTQEGPESGAGEANGE